MHIRRGTLLIAAVATLAACGSDDDDTTTGPTAERWSAALAGSNEVPAVTTTATGSATFEAVGDTAISFSISVAGLTGATMGHIHAGAAGANGGILVWLLPANGTAAQSPAPQLTGVISSGTLSRPWIRGTTPITLDSLKALMRARNVYVNLHTSAFGGGEVRGQIGPTQ